MRRISRIVAPAAMLLLSLPASPLRAQRLEGFADLHTHPMSHLGFGGMILFGAPDPGALMIEGQKYRGWHSGAPNCWPDEPAGSVEYALGWDAPLHGGHGGGTTSFGDANNCGDHIRQQIVERVDEKYDHPSGSHWRRGYPDFTDWPHWSTVTHQQMYVDWIKRSFDTGQRVMVALAVNNELLAKAANGRRAVDDKASVDLQLTEIESFVRRHAGFMEVARSPADLRRIVLANKLAIVLGVETDDFGNLTRRASFGGERITQATVDTEIRRLYDRGVRYLFPIHLSNTVLGGYAVNKSLFALSSKYYSNGFPEVRETCGAGIHFDLRRTDFGFPASDALRSRNLGWVTDSQPNYTPPRSSCGHQNSLGLTPFGRGALQTMMNLGMMIDIDHMSRQAADEALALAETRGYPLNSGHNGPVGAECLEGRGADLEHCSENGRTAQQYQAIRRLRGMVGLGHGGKATNFVRTYRQVLRQMGNRSVAIGTDANGLETLPAPDPAAPVRYDATFPRYRFGNRTWDLNVDGFAHYGLFPDYIRSWQASADPATRMTASEMATFRSSAEYFARMWERSLLRSAGAPRALDSELTASWCTQAGAVLYPGDFNGDGAADLLCKDAGRIAIDYADRSGRLAGTTDWSKNSTWCTNPEFSVHPADFNGDGRTDLLCLSSTQAGYDFADNEGHLGWGEVARDLPSCGTGSEFHLGDFNGDGRTDLLCRRPSPIPGGPRWWWIFDHADGGGRFGHTDWTRFSDWCTHPGAKLRVADFDGDGRSDLFCKDGGRMWIDNADEQGRFAVEDWTKESTWCTEARFTLQVTDLNGDGRSDLYCHEPGRGWYDFADAEGHVGWAGESIGLPRCSAGGTVHLADFNGDGRTDLLCRNRTSARIDYADGGGRFNS